MINTTYERCWLPLCGRPESIAVDASRIHKQQHNYTPCIIIIAHIHTHALGTAGGRHSALVRCNLRGALNFELQLVAESALIRQASGF